MIHSSAPGKILWIGGYSVLERPNISLITTVNARVHAYIKERTDEKIILDMPQFRIRKEISELKNSEIKTAKFVLSAIKTIKEYIQNKKGFEIKTISEDAFSVNAGKSGLGSSAAVTVASIGALLKLNGIEDKELLHKLSQYAHANAQGKVGSGFDIASAVYGTISYSRYSASLITLNDKSKIKELVTSTWDYKIEKVQWPKHFKIIVGNFIRQNTSTQEMIEKVREFKKNNPEKYKILIDKLNKENEKTIEFINNLEKFKLHFNNARLLTKELGELSGAEIEPEKSTKLIEKLVKNGAYVAKLPGAGGGDSIAAICLDKKSKEKIKNLLKQNKEIELLNIKVEDKGFIVEEIELNNENL